MEGDLKVSWEKRGSVLEWAEQKRGKKKTQVELFSLEKRMPIYHNRENTAICVCLLTWLCYFILELQKYCNRGESQTYYYNCHSPAVSN